MRWPAKPVSPAMQWDDPLASGLLHYQVMSDGTGPNAFDLARSARCTFTGGTAPVGPSWVRGHAGPELDFNGVGRHLSCPVRGLPTGSFDLTVVAAYRTTDVGNNRYVLHYGSAAGTNDMFAVGFDNAGQFRVTHWAAGSNVAAPTVDGRPHVAAWTYRATTGTWQLWIDGTALGSFVLAVNITSTPVLNIGSLVGAANLRYIGQLAMVGFWSRVLPYSAIVRLAADPFTLGRRPSYLDVWTAMVAGLPPPFGDRVFDIISIPRPLPTEPTPLGSTRLL